MTFDDENDINIQNNTKKKNKPKEKDFYSTTIPL